MESSREYASRVLKKYEFKTKKSLGQNFLVNDEVLERIVSYVPAGSAVFEIGPGIGLLTRKLIGTASKVITVEIDDKLCDILREEMPQNNLKVIDADIMDMDIDSILPEKSIAIANIPYYITTPIITKIMTSSCMITDAMLTIQKEAARKVVAQPGDEGYGILSLVCEIYGRPEVLFNVSRASFLPQPKVESSVVHFNKRKPDLSVDERDLLKVIKTSFGKRRKTVFNSLSTLFAGDRDSFKELLSENGIDPMARPDSLTCRDFELITGIIFDKS